jgi:hypothetical protein
MTSHRGGMVFHTRGAHDPEKHPVSCARSEAIAYIREVWGKVIALPAKPRNMPATAIRPPRPHTIRRLYRPPQGAAPPAFDCISGLCGPVLPRRSPRP